MHSRANWSLLSNPLTYIDTDPRRKSSLVCTEKNQFEARVATVSMNFVPVFVHKNAREHVGVPLQPLATSMPQKTMENYGINWIHVTL